MIANEIQHLALARHAPRVLAGISHGKCRRKPSRLQHYERVALRAMDRLRFEVFGYGSYAAFANRMKQITLGRARLPHPLAR